MEAGVEQVLEGYEIMDYYEQKRESRNEMFLYAAGSFLGLIFILVAACLISLFR